MLRKKFERRMESQERLREEQKERKVDKKPHRVILRANLLA